MAIDVQVDISDRAVISACNTPGGPIYEWRDDTAVEIIRLATAASPVNDILNTLHDLTRPPIGDFQRKWGFDRRGSNGHRVQATIFNGSEHADIVEFGRRRTFGQETFAWTEHIPPGETDTHPRGTAGREGNHVLRNAVNAHGARTGDYAPLP